MRASTFTGVRVAHRAATTRSTRSIDTAIVARRTKASAPSKKSAFKVRRRAIRWHARARIFSISIHLSFVRGRSRSW